MMRIGFEIHMTEFTFNLPGIQYLEEQGVGRVIECPSNIVTTPIPYQEFAINFDRNNSTFAPGWDVHFGTPFDGVGRLKAAPWSTYP